MRAEREMIKRENKPFDVEINKAEFIKKRKSKNTPTCALASEMSGWKIASENKRNEVCQRRFVIYIDSDESSQSRTYTRFRTKPCDANRS